jgi:hypothetical protein
MSVDFLLSAQNPDGGWSYVRGASWTEPTVYATLALTLSGETVKASRGLAWLNARQLSDGGWPPKKALDESSWVTALVALIPPETLGPAAHERAIGWLLRTEGEETTRIYRWRDWLLGNSAPPEQEFPGWPWTQGAAAWVGPTSLAILALEMQYRRAPSSALARRIADGRNFLLRRMCAGGGWNHGSVRALGYESDPYPETTGMALAAMRGVQTPALSRSLELAQRFVSECRSADAYNWLRLGLLAHGGLPDSASEPQFVRHTISEVSMDVLVGAASKGRNLFWN